MKVLIVKTSSMGDVIHTFPAVQDALRARANISFDWCVEEPFASIVALHPAIGTIHKVALRRWRRQLASPATWREGRALRDALRAAHYDLVLDAQGLLKSAFVAKFAGAPIAGFDRASAREPSAALFYDQRYGVPRDLHAIERTRRLFALALGYEPDLSILDSGIAVPSGHSPIPTGRVATLLHGTSREDKKWPVQEWIATAELLVGRGFTPVTTWSNEKERAVAEAVGKAVPATLVVPKSPLVEVAGLIGRSTLVIGADTGLTHLAAAFGLPTVAIFLTTEPGLTGPRGQYASTLVTHGDQPVTPQAAVAEAMALLRLKGR
ncbi:MAG: lipopolysaccharide heptosyltransferase I [Aquamicrobium sp.]|uniref:lipopolysaccharide heptosyltransferase I n=1 Tax=Mesorhizobium sp. Pch-S TaxID=2082387 RepID=UPI0010126ADB|nr:lipopolysaccharide heptosyltransferase I [Mesorhizobium sp. Pch-S]MBR2687204.1 lipopolysaccharide heptosyltransferase I [Aquamicrobium sp.]QAZ44936.1 lipopolysaccharide heptosyltransferase I [Mesorhizobium sp. Pch-S]